MRAFAIATALIAVTFAGCAADETGTTTTDAPTITTTTQMMDHTPRTHAVALQGSAFVNASLTVMMGDSVQWTHSDGTTAHTVTADDGSFDSSPNCAAGVPVGQVCMVDGSTFSQTFQKAGTVKYHCKVHSGMTGTITVQDHMAMASP